MLGSRSARGLILPAVCVTAILLAAPVAYLLSYGVYATGSGFTFANFDKLLRDPFYFSIFGRTFFLSVLATVLAGVFGYGFAHFMWRADRRCRGVLTILLRLVGLGAEIAAAKPRALSAGSQQRVNIARAIAVEPELIVLDEPTSALTPLARIAIIRLLRDLQARLGVSYLFISHDLNTVEHMSHRVAVMYLGQIVELGTREQIFHDPLHPYSKALLGAHLVADPARPPSGPAGHPDAQRRNPQPNRFAARLLSRQPLPGLAPGVS
jgi:ABC-type dipeptide/oligopeptide/nickel transport system ATPase component